MAKEKQFFRRELFEKKKLTVKICEKNFEECLEKLEELDKKKQKLLNELSEYRVSLMRAENDLSDYSSSFESNVKKF